MLYVFLNQCYCWIFHFQKYLFLKEPTALQRTILLSKDTLFQKGQTFLSQSTVSTGIHASGKIRPSLTLKGIYKQLWIHVDFINLYYMYLLFKY